MSISYFVKYAGQAHDSAAFLQYYATTHAAILKRLPGLRALTLHSAAAWRDPFPVTPGADFLMAQMEFDDAAALNAALASPVRAEARDDFAHFPKFDGEVRHQAMLARPIIR